MSLDSWTKMEEWSSVTAAPLPWGASMRPVVFFGTRMS
jgi:hypothetical protein